MNKQNRLSLIKFHSLLLGFLFSTTALSATDSVLVTGTVQEVITVVISGGSPAFSITPEIAVDILVGTITINSNDPDGYDVTLKSDNTGGLKNGDADETIAYQVSYDGNADITLVTTTTNVETVTTATTAGEVTRALRLKIAGTESKGKSAEDFTDTITMEILGK
jgi:hypothetical protein